MDLDFVSVHKHAKKELGQYPVILTSRLVNNPYILAWCESIGFFLCLRRMAGPLVGWVQWPPGITTNPSNTTVHLKRGCTNTPTSPGNRTPPLPTMNKRQTDKRRIASRRCLAWLTLLNDNSTKRQERLKNNCTNQNKHDPAQGRKATHKRPPVNRLIQRQDVGSPQKNGQGTQTQHKHENLNMNNQGIIL